MSSPLAREQVQRVEVMVGLIAQVIADDVVDGRPVSSHRCETYKGVRQVLRDMLGQQ
ncbi:hypothetical protein SAMN06264364_13841 [Quadrisphaera granulorum]|uniref:Uncharacterized protein n=1 Tax=Quadrisphaera granulorum TaxID=317664 RepID=A0A315ZQ20_9ACTN|nr:hypothetical protein [Quadrisphaera granulorum]PWJ47392.1 hypothetical protein BXY45_13841 [Quadrisphaera granulorum]SZE98839.1 hypothetical protein SAMN06264364_13841 [Quadrisphaera granulorum]